MDSQSPPRTSSSGQLARPSGRSTAAATTVVPQTAAADRVRRRDPPLLTLHRRLPANHTAVRVMLSKRAIPLHGTV